LLQPIGEIVFPGVHGMIEQVEMVHYEVRIQKTEVKIQNTEFRIQNSRTLNAKL
jgi:hypothetical protein